MKMISENRARFCMAILDKLQDRFPVVASFYPIYEALLKRYGLDVPHADKTGSGPEVGESMDNVAQPNECSVNTPDSNGDSFDQIIQDSMSGTFPFSLPFGNLFEDILMSSPPPES